MVSQAWRHCCKWQRLPAPKEEASIDKQIKQTELIKYRKENLFDIGDVIKI